MYKFAIHEVHDLLGRAKLPVGSDCPIIRYICALFSEIAYYHVPAFEVDAAKRAKIVPCDAYQHFSGKGRSLNTNALLRNLDSQRAFVASTGGSVAVGVTLKNVLFIGFRGTQFLFDWPTNLRSLPVREAKLNHPKLSSLEGRLHRGFGVEAIRISVKILEAIQDWDLEHVDHAFFAGHSLGGAIAAISEKLIPAFRRSTTHIFGTPRYCSCSAYDATPDSTPYHIRRSGDVVPTIPPRWFGYCDHPHEFDTSGTQLDIIEGRHSFLGDSLQWVRFMAKWSGPHNIELYRNELGQAAGAKGALLKLAEYERLTRADVAPV